MIKLLRKNIGTIIAGLGFALLCILTFGDIGDILSADYWKNVSQNITSIGFMTVSLTMIQVSIKQGIGEQALSKGLNTQLTQDKYEEHRNLIRDANDKMIYMSYFLQDYNKRHTALKKLEFLVNNNFSSEESLMKSGKKSLIKKYKKTRVYLTLSRIKWATTDVCYNKYGQIITLAEHRSKRTIRAITLGLFFMVGATLLTRGLFFNQSDVPLGEKFVKLFTYVLTIAITSLPIILKEYEKGAFGVPNDLEELNNIWTEFKNWPVPEWVKKEVKEISNEKEGKRSYSRTDIQEQQEEKQNIRDLSPNSVVSVLKSNNDILYNDNRE